MTGMKVLQLLSQLSAPAGAGAPAAGGQLAALTQLLSGLNGTGPAALAPLLQAMGGAGRPPFPAAEPASGPAAADTAAVGENPPSGEEPPAADTAGSVPTGPRMEQPPPKSAPAGSRRRKGGAPAWDPALLQLLAGLSQLHPQPQQPPPPQPATSTPPPEEDFDPCAYCPRPCPRRTPGLSFAQVQALAAGFPAYC